MGTKVTGLKKPVFDLALFRSIVGTTTAPFSLRLRLPSNIKRKRRRRLLNKSAKSTHAFKQKCAQDAKVGIRGAGSFFGRIPRPGDKLEILAADSS